MFPRKVTVHAHKHTNTIWQQYTAYQQLGADKCTVICVISTWFVATHIKNRMFISSSVPHSGCTTNLLSWPVRELKDNDNCSWPCCSAVPCGHVQWGEIHNSCRASHNTAAISFPGKPLPGLGLMMSHGLLKITVRNLPLTQTKKTDMRPQVVLCGAVESLGSPTCEARLQALLWVFTFD